MVLNCSHRLMGKSVERILHKACKMQEGHVGVFY